MNCLLFVTVLKFSGTVCVVRSVLFYRFPLILYYVYLCVCRNIFKQRKVRRRKNKKRKNYDEKNSPAQTTKTTGCVSVYVACAIVVVIVSFIVCVSFSFMQVDIYFVLFENVLVAITPQHTLIAIAYIDSTGVDTHYTHIFYGEKKKISSKEEKKNG